MARDCETLRLETKGAVATITLNRPEALNAFNEALVAELDDALQRVGGDEDVRCVIITGAGRAFGSGQDLKELTERYGGGYVPYLGEHLRRHYNPMISRIFLMEKPVIAAVNGVAAGAGCSLALACDLRIAAESASFIEAFVHVGAVPDCASTFTLPRLAGMAKAAEMCFFGDRITAAEALAYGLVNRVVPNAELMTEAGRWAARLETLPTKTIALTKRLLSRSFCSTLEAQLDREAFTQDAACQTADHLEGVRAFVEKRAPTFRGV